MKIRWKRSKKKSVNWNRGTKSYKNKVRNCKRSMKRSTQRERNWKKSQRKYKKRARH